MIFGFSFVVLFYGFLIHVSLTKLYIYIPYTIYIYIIYVICICIFIYIYTYRQCSFLHFLGCICSFSETQVFPKTQLFHAAKTMAFKLGSLGSQHGRKVMDFEFVQCLRLNATFV